MLPPNPSDALLVQRFACNFCYLQRRSTAGYRLVELLDSQKTLIAHFAIAAPDGTINEAPAGNARLAQTSSHPAQRLAWQSSLLHRLPPSRGAGL
jgi:hypothetical protein